MLIQTVRFIFLAVNSAELRQTLL